MIIKRLLTPNKYTLIIAIIYSLTIIVLSLINPKQLPDTHNLVSDKIGHFTAYFILTIIWFIALSKYKKSLKFALIIAFLLGLLLEFMQATLTTYRMFDYMDLLANTLGIIFAVVLLIIISKR